MTSNVIASQQARTPSVQRWLHEHLPCNLINNRWVPAKSGKTFDSVNPATELVLTRVAASDEADVDAAVAAARAAFDDGPWPRMSPHQRGRILRRWADLVDASLEECSEIESLDNGMAISTSRAYQASAVEYLQYFAGAAPQVAGDTLASGADTFNYVLREPLGVVGAIIAWNAPLSGAVWKFGPALAAGNTMVMKPAEQASLSVCRLGELAVEAGLPEGVFNIVTGFGDRAGAAVGAHLDIDKITFTGSTETGRRIVQASTRNLKLVSLELGGKSPNIVFADADLEQALPATLAAFTALAGQVCAAGTRVFVQREVKDEFVARLTELASRLRLGDPLDHDTQVGPLASEEQFERVRTYLELGVEEGAVTRGGGVLEGPGYYVAPTVFDNVENSMRIAQEEIFGPVASVIAFSDEEEAVHLANQTSYGLAAAVWTRDVTRAHRVVRALKAGTVWVNTYYSLDATMPFGGYKESGTGRELGLGWYHDYTHEKAVSLRL